MVMDGSIGSKAVEVEDFLCRGKHDHFQKEVDGFLEMVNGKDYVAFGFYLIGHES